MMISCKLAGKSFRGSGQLHFVLKGSKKYLVLKKSYGSPQAFEMQNYNWEFLTRDLPSFGDLCFRLDINARHRNEDFLIAIGQTKVKGDEDHYCSGKYLKLTGTDNLYFGHKSGDDCVFKPRVILPAFPPNRKANG